MNNKILLFGGNGQIGFELRRSLMCVGTVIAVNRQDCDLTKANDIRRVIRQFSPNIIVNAAAYTAVDRAETDVAIAYSINAIAPKIIGEEANIIGAFVVHYSSDYVFDGDKECPYNESDLPNPKNIYGKTKLAGERYLSASNPLSLIIRTSWVIGANGRNFAKSILSQAQINSYLRVVDNQYGAPTSAAIIADVTSHIIKQYVKTKGINFPFGLYHLALNGKTNWYECACFVIKIAISLGKQFSIEKIVPVSSQAYQAIAKRPNNSMLNTQLIRDNFGICLPDWQDGLKHVLYQIL